MDADLSHSPDDVPRLVDALADYDVAVGSRYVAGGGVDDLWGFNRLALSRSANALSRLILGLKVRDATSGFKAWRRSALEAIELGGVRSNGYFSRRKWPLSASGWACASEKSRSISPTDTSAGPR